MSVAIPALVAKALADTGYDLLSSADNGWIAAAISGNAGRILVQAADDGVLLAVAEPTMAQRIGLEPTAVQVPSGMAGIGIAYGAMQLYEALRVLHSLQTHPVSALSARVEARLAGIPETERTREVRQRIGQDVFREALMDLWQGRCAVTGIPFPRELLRASHAKPWAKASDAERLDPFNGLLLATHLDAMFDSGLIGFGEDGVMLFSPQLDLVVRSHFGVHEGSRLRSVAPGHMPYLAWHREFIVRK
ncbi:HNH endonuclease signature motif containing protein [Luteimonas sp. MC1828]|uniref:HNH endonuclease n=1 Tax=Luteimonas sp. MC1828 TaxID=2799787 RepID=UPI0018F1917E|nr:HNH endonuclease signature motif containing protein [Luteimonas sp. MC1828]MBJ7574541.1 HNH endonuclease [Luteimonas sp. MC1828]